MEADTDQGSTPARSRCRPRHRHRLKPAPDRSWLRFQRHGITGLFPPKTVDADGTEPRHGLAELIDGHFPHYPEPWEGPVTHELECACGWTDSGDGMEQRWSTHLAQAIVVAIL